MDVKLLVLCGVRVADLALAGERERVLAMAGSRIWVDIARFVLLGRLGNEDAGIVLYNYVGEGKPGGERNIIRGELRFFLTKTADVNFQPCSLSGICCGFSFHSF